ncbi:DNA-(apurinic or apyrimidinic site) lyase 2 [Artemisia annua]|uniref:DNA-(Apurinic or apyrimidinic site) lyase 2 n=1 Tax=Artemisia annua TaxID=35608 RepID=A0A2U1LMG0_ARTAN|nr:DNA-(apurinic or apyrimidinic site) lyase 2 [Artemisia annua]
MNVLCGCGEVARLRTSWTQHNPARRFLGCPNYLDPTTNCNFFQWVDAPLPNRWYQARMYEMHLSLVNGQQEIAQANNNLTRSKFYNRILIVLMVSMLVIRFIS